jgi:uncharacterized membrane protein YbhN (UPF0104 family)
MIAKDRNARLTNGVEPLAKQSARNPRRLNMRAVLIGLIETSLSILLLWVIFSHINLTDVKSRLAELTFVAATLVGALMALHAILSAVRWQVLISHFGGTMKLGPAISAVLIERFVNQAVPSPMAGDGARFVELMRNGQNMRVGAYSIVIDRLFAVGGIFGVVTMTLPLAPWVIKSDHILKSIIAIAVVPVVSIAILALVRRRWWEGLRKLPLLHYPIGLVVRLRDVVIAPRKFIVSAGLSILVQMLPIPCFLILASDLHVPLMAADAAVIVPLILLAGVLPISIAGWGVREGAAVVLMSQVNVAAADAVSLSVLFGLITLVTSCLGGIVWLMTRHRVQTQ